VLDRLRARAREHPTRQAFRCLRSDGAVQTAWSYGELHDRVVAAGEALRQRASPGSRVALLFPAGLEFVEALLGCFHAGLVAVPLQPPLGAQAPLRIGHIIADADPAIGLTTEALLPRVRRQAEDGPKLRAIDWHVGEQLAREDVRVDMDVDRDPAGAALLQYTSGSTGAPKGVVITHANLMANATQVHRAFGEPAYDTDRMVCWLPPFHDMGLMSGVIGPIVSGIEAILLPPAAVAQRPLRWLAAMSECGATLSGAPNFAYDECVSRIDDADRQSLRLGDWRVAFCGAEPIRSHTLERFARAFAAAGFRESAYLPCYGLAEATVAVTASREAAPVTVVLDSEALQSGVAVDAESSGRSLVACGAPVSGLELLIVDPADHRECLPNRVGEIWVRGDNVAAGYWRRAELSVATFEACLDDGRGPFLRTGDLGFVRDGRLFVTGRIKDLIIIRGQNHYPQDLELTAARSAPSLVAGGAAAFSLDASPRERIVVMQEIRRAARAELHGVCDAIRAAIVHEHGIAADAIVLVDQGRLPKTSSGKIRRDACRALLAGADLEVLDAWCADPADYSRFTWKTGKYVPRRPLA
jgi:acyl-CoA synthetase (AMP-forming)/AMP-acid ligase II